MAQQFNTQTQTRLALLLYAKSWAMPVVLYFQNPEEKYEEIQNIIKNPTQKVVEFEATGPVKKFSILASEITSVGLQEERRPV